MNPCGKEWHDTRQSASERMHKMRLSPSCRKPDNLNVYYCEDCDGWHVGHTVWKPWHTLCIGERK